MPGFAAHLASKVAPTIPALVAAGSKDPIAPRRLGLGPGDVCWEQLGMGPSGSYDLGYLVGFDPPTRGVIPTCLLICGYCMGHTLRTGHVSSGFAGMLYIGYLGSGKSGFQCFYFHSIPVMHDKYVKLVNGDH